MLWCGVVWCGVEWEDGNNLIVPMRCRDQRAGLGVPSHKGAVHTVPKADNHTVGTRVGLWCHPEGAESMTDPNRLRLLVRDR